MISLIEAQRAAIDATIPTIEKVGVTSIIISPFASIGCGIAYLINHEAGRQVAYLALAITAIGLMCTGTAINHKENPN